MRTTSLLLVSTVLCVAVGTARADLVSEFAGFDSVWEVGVSGLQSSYHADMLSGLPVSGPTTGNFLPVFGPDRVSYPSGVGEVPSPGGEVGQHFDQGVLGVRVDGDQLVVQIATGISPQVGYYHSGWNTWYSQGDVFISVEDSAGVSHFALLNSWARDGVGDPLELNAGHFSLAQEFHLAGGAGGTSLEGHLVRLSDDNDVTLTGGTGAYGAGNAPAGLDIRGFAQDGIDLGDANLTHSSLGDFDQMWYLQSWAIGLDSLSSDALFDIGLHAAASCGNDQIGGSYTVPEPNSVLLVLGGSVLLACFRRLG
jgi:hypothetical protein